MELRHLRHALALAEQRNFARAAETLHMTQPALSRSIQSLEQTVGDLLFDRGSREVTPTALGELVLRHARGLLLAAEELERDVQLARGLELGELRVGVGPFAGAALVDVPLGQLIQRYPQLRLAVVEAPWQELPGRLQRREIDLVVATVHQLEGQAEYDFLPLGDHPTVPLCRTGHPLLSDPAPSLAALLRYPLAGPHLPEEARQQLFRLMPPPLRRSTQEHLRQAIVCDSSAMLRNILKQSDALTLMPLFIALADLHAGQLQLLPLPTLNVRGRFGVAWLRGRTLSAPAQQFIQRLQAHDQALSEQEQALLATV